MDIIHMLFVGKTSPRLSPAEAADAAESSFDGQPQETLTPALSLSLATIMR